MFSWLKNRAWPVIAQTWEGWNKDDGWTLAAAMAYYATISLFPLILVLISILGYVMRFSQQAQGAQEQLLKSVAQNASPWVAEQLSKLLGNVQAQAGVGGPLGLLFLVFVAIGVFLQLDRMFNRIWGTHGSEQSQSWLGTILSTLYERFSAFLMLLVAGGLLAALFFADLILSGIRAYVVQMPGGQTTWQWGQIIITLLVNTLIFAFIYKMLPRAPVPWKPALLGGLVVAIVWRIGQEVLSSVVISDNYSAYGVVGALLALMLWIYYAAVIVFMGAEFVQAVTRQRA